MAKRTVKVRSKLVDQHGKHLTRKLPDHEERVVRAQTLKTGLTFDESRYEFNDKFVPASSIQDAHTLPELVHFAEKDKSIDIQARVLGITSQESKRRGRASAALTHRTMGKAQFISTFKKNTKLEKYRESVDSFLTDGDDSVGGLIGDDFISLLGGPFNKQLYYYDYLRMHAIAFHAFHHDPIAKRIVNMMNQFTLGKGFRVDVTASDKNKDAAMALWSANQKINNLFQFAKFSNIELSTYGEIMPWELPNNQVDIQYDVRPGQEVPVGLIPRWRLIDPSVIWEIVTYPEDIERVLYYQWVAPTQYQMYTGMDAGQPVPSTKFIVQQIAPEEVLHRKINCVSNEKRGRSDLFAILGYLKRLRDSVNYEMIAQQKNSAWSIDTQVEGSQTDIDNYIRQQQAQSTIMPAGSEFVHSKKVTRTYNSNQQGRSGSSPAFEWCLSMIAIGAGIPVSYFGTHFSGGQTRASALVGTEPVTKVFEERQQILEGLVVEMGERLFRRFGIDAELEVTFPEIISQDRSTKIKDIIASEQAGYLKPERAAAMVAKELGITDYVYDEEQLQIRDSISNGDPAARPLTDAGSVGQNSNEDPEIKPSAVTGQERQDVKQNDGA